MNLYLLTRNDSRYPCGVNRACVVAAESEEQARATHPGSVDYDNARCWEWDRNNRFGGTWPQNSALIDCTLIGVAVPGTLNKVILVDYIEE